MATEITTEELVEAATAPSTVSVDGQTVSERSIDQLIKADQYAAVKTATATGRSAWGGVRMAKAVPPGGSG